MSNKLDAELENLRHSEQIKEWSVSLGYGEAEYTVEFASNRSPNLKLLAKRLNEKYGAHDFTKYSNSDGISLKFVITL